MTGTLHLFSPSNAEEWSRTTAHYLRQTAKPHLHSVRLKGISKTHYRIRALWSIKIAKRETRERSIPTRRSGSGSAGPLSALENVGVAHAEIDQTTLAGASTPFESQTHKINYLFFRMTQAARQTLPNCQSLTLSATFVTSSKFRAHRMHPVRQTHETTKESSRHVNKGSMAFELHSTSEESVQGTAPAV